MNNTEANKLILHLHELQLKSESQPFNLKFVIFQGEQNTQTKLQSRKQICLKNNRAIIQQAFELQLTKDKKILMIILKTKLKETSFLGQIHIDTNRYIEQNLNSINIQAPISKCSIKDDNAKLSLTLSFLGVKQKQPLREYQIQRTLNRSAQNKEGKALVTSTGSIPSKCQSESTIKNDKTRRISSDFYKKNYKNLQITRDDKSKNKDDVKSRQRSGSYKKRFQYQQGMRSKPKNTIIFMKQKKQKIKQKQPVPVAREKTPQPIKLDKLSYLSQSNSRPSSKHSFSKQSSIKPRIRHATERSNQKPNKMYISIHAKTQRYETQSQAVNDQRQNTFSKNSSNNSILQENKYSNLIDKLRQIQTKIQDKKSIQKSYDKYISNSNSNSKSSSKYQSPSQPIPQSQPIFNSKSNSKSPQIQDSNANSITYQISPLTLSQTIPNSVNKSAEYVPKQQPIVEQFKHEQNRQSVCTFGDAVKTSQQIQSQINNRKLFKQLQDKIQFYQQTIKSLQIQKSQSQSLITKLSQRYQSLIQQCQNLKDPYQKQISKLQQQISKLKKPKQSNVQKQLKLQRRKNMSLQNSLLLKQNQIKHIKLNIKSLQDEKQQLESILNKKQYRFNHINRLVQYSSRSLLELENMNNGYSVAIKSENQLLHSQNQLLQKHIKELNQLIAQYEYHNNIDVDNIKIKEIKQLKDMNQLLNKNVSVQSDKNKKLEKQLRRIKLNFAQMMNVVFEKGGEELVQIIERKILQRQSSGYISSSDVQ